MKFKIQKNILEYQFEENNEEYLRNILSLGVSKKMATILVGNGNITLRSQEMKEFLKKYSEIEILKTENDSNIYLTKEKTINDFNFFELVCEEILKLRLFGFRYIVLTKQSHGKITFEISYLDNQKVKSSEISFIDLTKIELLEKEDIKNCIIIDNDVILSHKHKDLLNNNIFCKKNKYFYLDEKTKKQTIYEGASFYSNNFFNVFLKNNQIERNIKEEDFIKSSNMRVLKNGFDFDRNILLNEDIKKEYFLSLNGNLNQEMIDLYNNYGQLNNEFINIYFDKQIDLYKVKQSNINSFREFEISFAFDYFNKRNIKSNKTLKDILNKDNFDENILSEEPKEEFQESLLDEDEFDETTLQENLQEEPKEEFQEVLLDEDEFDEITSQEDLQEEPKEDFQEKNKNDDISFDVLINDSGFGDDF